MPDSKPGYPEHKSADFAAPDAAPPASSPQRPRSAAQDLIEKTGSPEQARQAIETAARRQAPPPMTKEDFARRWGFASFLELFEASRPLAASEGTKKWCVTGLRGGKWLLWNDADMSSAREFDSLEEAQRQAPSGKSGEDSQAARMQG